MGNYGSRKDSEGSDLLINRCPGRNRCLSNLASKDDSQEFHNSLIHSSENSIFSNEHKQISIYKSPEFEPLNYDEKEYTKRKKRQQKKIPSRIQELKAENSSDAENFEYYKKSKTKKRKQQRVNKREQRELQNFDLILNILETVANLEATFIEEKRYERRLFTAVEAQIQEIQRFNLLLDKEKGQNKKLLALLNCSNEACESNTQYDGKTNERCEKVSLHMADRKIYTRNLSASMSPLLLQQRCDELAANLNHCRAELSNKNKEVVLSQCNLNELQENCDTLNKDLQDSFKKMDALNQEIICLKQERKYLKKELRAYRQNRDKRSGLSGKLSDSSSQIYLDEEQDTVVNRTDFVIKRKAE